MKCPKCKEKDNMVGFVDDSWRCVSCGWSGKLKLPVMVWKDSMAKYLDGKSLEEVPGPRDIMVLLQHASMMQKCAEPKFEEVKEFVDQYRLKRGLPVIS